MKNTISLLAIALCLVGVYSCQKEDVRPTAGNDINITPLGFRDGGDDDEDPIIQGYIKKDSVLVDSVRTFIFPTGSQAFVFQTENSNFEAQVPKGSYFFQFISSVGDTTTTSDYWVGGDMEITFNL